MFGEISMAIVSEDGTMRGSIGNRTYRYRLGQNVVSRKPRNTTLVGVKWMDDDDLQKLANRTGYSVDDLKKIRAKQQAMDDAVSACKGKDLSAPQFRPTKPGETRFNRCVGLALKGGL